MKPIAICQHIDCEGPAYFGQFLKKQGIPYQHIAIDQGQAVPLDGRAYSGLVFMGGPMSANDPLPWIEAELQLIRRAADQGQAMLGHCLGGQLIAKALGGSVFANPVKEIGWHAVTKLACPSDTDWLDTLPEQFEAFHWHGEQFSLPTGATALLRSQHCTLQAFSLNRILALQCHVEMTATLVDNWTERYQDELSNTPSEGIQPREAIHYDIDARITQLHAVANAIYTRWLQGITR